MDSILKTDKLEELLIANWTKYFDVSRLMSLVLEEVRKSVNNFTISEMVIHRQGVKISLSRCQLIQDGFILWVEFAAPLDNKMGVGTVEFHLSNLGKMKPIQTIGTLYTAN